MIGAATLVNPLLRIATMVAILGAVYLFVVRPVLDTASDTIDRAFESAQPALDDLNGVQKQAERRLRAAGIDPQRAIAIAADAEHRAGRLLGCVNRAHGDLDGIAACGERFGS